ncbi:hypothetical protein H0H93_001768, partial [Arthromyces matolae]
MSRLPRLHSSPPRAMPTLKRKTFDDDDEDEALDQPRKLPAIGASRPTRTLQPSRTAPNLTKIAGGPSIPKPLTKPKAPTLTKPSTSRGTSAPPSTRPVVPPPRPTGRSASGRSVTGGDDKRFNQLQTRLTSIESARAADAARLAQDMAAERAKVSELQDNHAALS